MSFDTIIMVGESSMDRELEVPEFVNDKYNQMQEEKKHKKIQKLKFYKKTFALIALGAGLVLAAPVVKEPVKAMIEKYIDLDNKRFDAEYQHQREEVIRLTGSTPEEITERGKML